MRITQYTSVTADASSHFKGGDSTSIPFCRQKDGSYTALLPIKLPNSGAASDQRVFSCMVPITVVSETTSNSRGVRRTMLKVSLPYQAVNTDAAVSDTDEARFDPARSGGIISAHLVVSIPKACETDLKGVKGTTAERSAMAQVMAAITLLLGAGGDLLHGNALTEDLTVVDAVNGTTIDPTEDRAYVLGNRGYLTKPVRLSDGIPGYLTIPGVDVSGAVNEFATNSNPIVRGLLGQTPICDEHEQVIPAIFCPATAPV